MCQHPLAQQGCSTQSRGKIPVAPTVRLQIPKSTQEWGQETLQGLPPSHGRVSAPHNKQSDPRGAPGKGKKRKANPKAGWHPPRC